MQYRFRFRLLLTLTALLVLPAGNSLAATPLVDVDSPASIHNDRFIQQSREAREAFEAMQEASFRAYIESMKNYPPAQNLPEALKQRRAAMIRQLEEQHTLEMKLRKERREAFEKRRQAYRMKMQKI